MAKPSPTLGRGRFQATAAFAFWLLSLAVLVPSAFAKKPFPKLDLEDGDQVLFLGDSITQAGRYIAYFQAYLWAEYPDLDVDVVNLGLGAETASGNSEPLHPYPRPDIHERIGRILENTHPDVAVICYGMNDAIYHPFSPERYADYQKGMTSLLGILKDAGVKQFVLMTPPLFDLPSSRRKNQPMADTGPDVEYTFQTPFISYDLVLQRYGLWVKEQSGEAAAIVDLHTALHAFLRQRRAVEPDFLYGDGVHPPIEGHLAMTLALLKALGEDPDYVDERLPELVGISLLPSDSKLSPLYQSVMKRQTMLSAAYREHVGHTKPQKSDSLPLEEAKAKAAEMEKEIRASLKAP